MNSLKTFFTVASGVFAVIPGLTILVSNLGVPPTSSSTLFAAIVEAIGVFTLIVLWINKSKIREKSLEYITKLSIKGIVIFVVSLFVYLFLFAYLTEDVPNSKSLFFPLWSQGDLKFYLVKFGSRSEMIKQLGRDDVSKLIRESSNTALIITTIILLSIYQLVFVSLTFSFGLLSIKGTNEKDEITTANKSIAVSAADTTQPQQ